MLQNDPGFARQEVRFELNEAQRLLDNIGTLSGRYVNLGDTSTPLGHLIPNLRQNMMACNELLSDYEQRHGNRLTFADLRRIKPEMHEVFCQAIQEVRQLDREIKYRIACEKMGIKPE